jgi:hypothetical protein
MAVGAFWRTGIYGPCFTRWTCYRSSLTRCGSKRVPTLLPRNTVPNSIGYTGKPRIARRPAIIQLVMGSAIDVPEGSST